MRSLLAPRWCLLWCRHPPLFFCNGARHCTVQSRHHGSPSTKCAKDCICKSFVLQSMKMIHSPEFDLFESLICFDRWSSAPHTVHDEAIQVLVLWKYLGQRLAHNWIVLCLFHGGDTKDPKIFGIDQNEPAMNIWFGFPIVPRATLMLGGASTLLMDLGASITNNPNNLMHLWPLRCRWGKDSIVEMSAVSLQGRRRKLCAENNLLAQIQGGKLIQGKPIHNGISMAMAKALLSDSLGRGQRLETPGLCGTSSSPKRSRFSPVDEEHITKIIRACCIDFLPIFDGEVFRRWCDTRSHCNAWFSQ